MGKGEVRLEIGLSTRLELRIEGKRGKRKEGRGSKVNDVIGTEGEV